MDSTSPGLKESFRSMQRRRTMREGQKARQGTQKGCKNFCFLTKPTTIHAASEINDVDTGRRKFPPFRLTPRTKHMNQKRKLET